MRALILDDSLILNFDNVSCIEKGDKWLEGEQRSLYLIILTEVGQSEKRELEFDDIQVRDKIWNDIKQLITL
jgi:hypothetical protein